MANTTNTKITELVAKINSSDEWDLSSLAELCELAGLEEEWNAADGESFEEVAYKAAEILGVEI